MIRSFLVAMMLALAGCAALTEKRFEKLDAEVERWLEEKEYGKALAALKKIPPNRPDYGRYAGMLSQVAAQAQLYEEETSRRSKEFIEENDWVGAVRMLEKGLARIPDSIALRDAVAGLHDKQKAAVFEQEEAILRARGEYLIKTLPAFRQIANVMVDDENALRRLREAESEGEEIAGRLAALGDQSIAREESFKALDYLRIAAELSEDPQIDEKYGGFLQTLSAKAAQDRVAEERQKQLQSSRLEKIEREFKRMGERFDAEMDKKNFAAAKQSLKTLQRFSSHDRETAEKRERFETEARSEAERLYRLGVEHYRSEQYHAAVRYWQKVLALDPQHEEAKNSLARAERVLQTIEGLKSKQKAE